MKLDYSNIDNKMNPNTVLSEEEMQAAQEYLMYNPEDYEDIYVSPEIAKVMTDLLFKSIEETCSKTMFEEVS